MIKVSVIIPCYNVAEYLPRCIESVITQTLKDIEIICIDDMSTDDTLNILKKYAKKDNRIHIINHKKNLGVAVARNDGMDAANGEYIGFIDPDDYIDTDFYEKLYNKAKKTNADIVKAGVISVNMNNYHISKNTFNQLYKFTNSFWSAIYKHDFLKKYNIHFPAHIRTSQDSVFLTQSCINTNNIEFVNNTFYHYFYQRPGSLDSKFLSRAKAESKYNAFLMNIQYIANKKLSKKITGIFLNAHVLSHTEYELSKNFEFDSDRKKFFNLLVLVYKKYNLNKYLKSRFGKMRFKCIKKDDYNGFMSYSRYRYYLFALIPIVLVETTNTIKCIKLFDIIPILKVKR